MNLNQTLVVCSVLLSVLGTYPYIRDTLAGTTKPNRVSWGMWALTSLIGTGAALSAGAQLWSVTPIFLAGFLPLVVFLASLSALAVWMFLGSPTLAVIVAVAGDALACIPTLIKAWRAPETETLSVFVTTFFSVLLVLPSIPTWDVPNSAFQIYLLAANFSLITIICRRKLLSLTNQDLKTP